MSTAGRPLAPREPRPQARTRRWRPTEAVIDLEAIRHNCGALGTLLRPGTEQMAVVKANGYGHGDVEVARACLEGGATRLGVAYVEEGVRLREAGIRVPILVLVEAPPEAAAEIVARRLTPTVSTRGGAEAISEAAAVADIRYPVHVAVDTGMHREGVAPSDARDLILYAAGLPGVVVEGLWSHFAVADEEGRPETARQLRRFSEVCDAVTRRGLSVSLRHIANSAGVMGHPDSHLDLVRCGIATYGLYPGEWLRDACELRPAMRLVSRVVSARDLRAGEGVSYGLTWAPTTETRIASVPIGYGDGYPRLASNRAEVLVRGRRRPVVGRVTMDQIMIDCGRDDIGPGEEVVLIGREGDEEVGAGELAEHVGTIHYEIVTGISGRVPRRYVG